jgi:NAD+ synthase
MMPSTPALAEVLALQESAVVDVICRALVREVRRVDVPNVVLGLSGGLDSALVAFLAVRAFGAGHVRVVCMPYTTSDPKSLEHALLVAGQLGLTAIVEPIGAQIDAYYADKPEADATRRGNKMARERMTILYDLSVREKALVLGTSNKTELLLGYTTLYGDAACAVMPIGDLYKAQVRKLARFVGVPDVVLDKPPSADLWEGQTDEAELGFTYEAVDALLFHLVDRRQRPARLIELGFSASFVEQVQRRMRASQFKRKLPVVIKLSRRTVDKDFLYPRDWTG